MKRLRVLLGSLCIALMATMAVILPTAAATTAGVTITVTPAFIGISNSVAAYAFPDALAVNTTYYTNASGDVTVPSATVIDANCYFTMTNTSTITIYMYLAAPNFTGGDAMTNSGTGSNGATSFGEYAWYSGETYTSKTAIGTTATKFNSAGVTSGTGTLKWGFELKTQSNAWASGTSETSVHVLSAASS